MADKCHQCGRSTELGKQRCARHLAINRRTTRQYSADRNAEGLCGRCGTRTKVEGQVHCPPCARKARKRAKSWRDRKLAKGLCGRCGRNPVGERRLKSGEWRKLTACDPCSDKLAGWRDRKKA